MNIPRSEPSLEQRLIGTMRVKHYSYKAEENYASRYYFL